jgi:hypothetical protein
MKVLSKYNSLQAKFPDQAKQFHPTKNIDENGKILTACDVIAGSNKKYWWICSKQKKIIHAKKMDMMF